MNGVELVHWLDYALNVRIGSWGPAPLSPCPECQEWALGARHYRLQSPHPGIGPKQLALSPPISACLDWSLGGLTQPPLIPACQDWVPGAWYHLCLAPPTPTLGPGGQNHLVPALCIGIRCPMQGARLGNLAVGKWCYRFPITKFPDLWGAPQAWWYRNTGQIWHTGLGLSTPALNHSLKIVLKRFFKWSHNLQHLREEMT